MSDEKLDREIRREQIAEAVLSLVAAHGVNRLSMASVAPGWCRRASIAISRTRTR